MVKAILICELIISFFSYSCFAQNNCRPEEVYKTDSMGEENEMIEFPLNFLIKSDSIFISFDAKGKNTFASYEILDKKCNWNENFSIGSTVYKLIISDKGVLKHPTLTIKFESLTKKCIELLYENSEARIFSIKDD